MTSPTTPEPRRQEIRIDLIEQELVRDHAGKVLSPLPALVSPARATICHQAIEEYADQMQAGNIFPPTVLFHDGNRYWLGDGLHRIKAAEATGQETIPADIRLGSKEDAAWYTYSCNCTHGVRRTHEDVRKVVTGALRHPRAAGMSDNALAKYLGVSDKTIAHYRSELAPGSSSENPKIRTVTRRGRCYRMNTAWIGKPMEPSSAEVSVSEANRQKPSIQSEGSNSRLDIRRKAHKRRMEVSLSELKGLCSSLAYINIPYVRDICSEGELVGWGKTILQQIGLLRKFKTALVGEEKGKRKKKRPAPSS